MLIFDRPQFKSGVTVCKELIKVEGKPDDYKIHKFSVKDKRKSFEFQNEEYMLEKYPTMFKLVVS